MLKNIANKKVVAFGINLSAADVIRNPLFGGSFIMIIGTNFANFAAYLYHLVIGRMLGPSSYGTVAATLATLAFFSTAFSFLGTVVIKFVSSSSEKDNGGLLGWFFEKALIIGLFLFVSILLFSKTLSVFLNFEIKIIYLIAPTVVVFLLNFILKSFLQGLMRFSNVVFLTNLELFGRLLLGAGLVYLGFDAFGAIWAISISSFLGVILGFLFLKDIKLKRKCQNLKVAKIFKYSIPVFLITVAGNSFMSSDVILAKHYFEAYDAGIYASLSTLSKIVFYATGPVTAVMFPLISKKYSLNRPYIKLLTMSALMVAFISATVLFIFWLFPELMINILFGKEFLASADKLFYFGIFVFIYSLANLMISFYLSIEKTKIWIVPVACAMIQILGIWIFHNNFMNLIAVSIVSASLLLGGLIIYFAYDQKKIVR